MDTLLPGITAERVPTSRLAVALLSVPLSVQTSICSAILRRSSRTVSSLLLTTTRVTNLCISSDCLLTPTVARSLASALA